MSTTTSASFLADPPVSETVEQLYAADLAGQGYVAHLTRLWAHSPESLHLLGQLLGLAGHVGGLDQRQRNLVVTAAASAMGDSYCSLAFGTKLAAAMSDDDAATVITGRAVTTSPEDAALVAWARQLAVDPSGTTAADVETLRAAGYDEQQILGLTVYIALRLTFSTVNDALGAAPDVELADRAPAGVRAAVDFGRSPA